MNGQLCSRGWKRISNNRSEKEQGARRNWGTGSGERWGWKSEPRPNLQSLIKDSDSTCKPSVKPSMGFRTNVGNSCFGKITLVAMYLKGRSQAERQLGEIWFIKLGWHTCRISTKYRQIKDMDWCPELCKLVSWVVSTLLEFKDFDPNLYMTLNYLKYSLGWSLML